MYWFSVPKFAINKNKNNNDTYNNNNNSNSDDDDDVNDDDDYTDGGFCTLLGGLNNSKMWT